MPILSALTASQCAAEAGKRELGPCLINLSLHCPGATPVPDVWFRANEQRNEASLNIAQQYIDIPNQASAIANKVESGQTMMLNVSVGSKILETSTLATVLGRTVVADATVTTMDSIAIVDAPGRVPPHYQVAIIPIKSGNILDFSYGFIISYAILKTDNLNLTFSVNTPLEGQFSLEGEPHPVTGQRGLFYRSRTGADLEILQSAVSTYITAYPQV